MTIFILWWSEKCWWIQKFGLPNHLYFATKLWIDGQRGTEIPSFNFGGVRNSGGERDFGGVGNFVGVRNSGEVGVFGGVRNSCGVRDFGGVGHFGGVRNSSGKKFRR